MKKLFTILAICLVCVVTVHAQKTTVPEGITKQKGNFTKLMTATKSKILAAKNEVILSPAAFNMPCGEIPDNLATYFYYEGPIAIFLTGTNPFGDIKYGYIFKGTSGDITSVKAWLYRPFEGDIEDIYAEVYAIGSNNLPTTLLGTSQPISTIDISDDDLDEYTFSFTTPVNVPENFAVAITVPEWSYTSSDIIVASSTFDCFAPGTETYSVAYTVDEDGEAWDAISIAWGFEDDEGIDLAIFPVLQTQSIKENVKTTFSITPNPATSNIMISAGSEFHQVEVVNFLGQTVLTQSNTGNKTSVDVSTLTNGVYFVRVVSDNGMEVKKFVKQ